jgi:hypothetical protein
LDEKSEIGFVARCSETGCRVVKQISAAY